MDEQLYPGDSPTLDLSERASGVIAKFVRDFQVSRASEETAEYRIPQRASVLGLLRQNTPPVVLDANVLRDDVLYSCRTNRRTTLVNGAIYGAFRLFACEHVMSEVFEHGDRWAQEGNVSRAHFFDAWAAKYKPLIFRVPDDSVGSDMLTEDEVGRLARLSDHDDLPSVRLSIVLGAFFASRDRDAVVAAYGSRVNFDEHTAWVETLKSGGEASLLAEVLGVGTAIPVAVCAGLFSLGKWLSTRYTAWSLLPIVGAVGYGLSRLTPEQRATIPMATKNFISAYGAVSRAYQAADQRLAAASVQIPEWGQLAGNRAALLARACAFTLARSPQYALSAMELSLRLPSLQIGKGPTLVRKVLRERSCFSKQSKGGWQLGLRD